MAGPKSDRLVDRRAVRNADAALIDAQAATRAAETRLAVVVAPGQERLHRAGAEREPLIVLNTDTERRQWMAEHPITERRLDRIAADLDTLDVVRDATIEAQRFDRLDWGTPMAQTARERADEGWRTLQAPEAERERLLDRQAEQTIQRDLGIGFYEYASGSINLRRRGSGPSQSARLIGSSNPRTRGR